MKSFLHLGLTVLLVVTSFFLTFVAAWAYMPRLHHSDYENLGYPIWTLLPAGVAAFASLVSTALALTLDRPPEARMRYAALWAGCCFVAVNVLNAIYVWATAIWGPRPSGTL
jgi:hypothetical protein